jgi:signal transduction histidine kinase
MDERTAAHAFEPFFTDKPRRGLAGYGLGLSVSHAIVERHEGRLLARSDGVGCGSVFTIELPLVRSNIASGRGVREVAVV